MDTNMNQKLIELLKDPDEDVRREALSAAIDSGNPVFFPYIIEALYDDNQWVRSTAIMGVWRLKISEAYPQILSSLQDPVEWVRQQAAETIGDMKCKEWVPNLISAYQIENNQRVKENIQNALIDIEDVQAIQIYIEALSTFDSWKQDRAIEVIGKVHGKEAVPQLVELLKKPGDLDISTLIDTLASLEAVQAVGLIEKYAKSKDEFVRDSAIKALGILGSGTSREIVWKATKDREATVRSSAIEAIKNLWPERYKDALHNALNDKDSEIQISSALALGLIGERESAIKFLHKIYKVHENDLLSDEKVIAGGDWTLIKVSEALGKLGEKEIAIFTLKDVYAKSGSMGRTYPQRAAWDLLLAYDVHIPNAIFEESMHSKRD